MRLVADTVWTWIYGYERGLLDPVTSYRMPGAWFSKLYKQGLWDGRVRFVRWHKSARQYYFATGLLDGVTNYLDQIGKPYSLEDRRVHDIVEPDFTLYDDKLGQIRIDQGKWSFQGEALETLLTHGRGIIKVATSGGKTVIGAAAIKSINRPSVWFTHRRNLLYQTQERLRERLRKPIGIIGDGKCQYEDVTVAMVQTCSYRTHDKFLKSREVVIGDEIHALEKSELWMDNFAAVPATWRIGLSATPEETERGMALLAMTGPVVYEVSAQQLIHCGVAVPPRIWIVKQDSPVIPKDTKWPDVYKQGIVENEDRNNQICDVASTLSGEGKPTLVLVYRIAHGKMLTRMLNAVNVPADFICGSVSEDRRQGMIANLLSGKIRVVVAVASTLGEGTDIPGLRAIVNATGARCGGDSTSEWETGRATIQILGRGLRFAPGKAYVDYVDFADTTHRFLKEASKARLSTLEDQGYGPFIEHWGNYAKACNALRGGTLALT